MCYNIIIIIITGAACVSELLKDNRTLQVLNIGGNHIGDDGMSLVLKELQLNNTMTELRIAGCGLSLQGTVATSYHIVMMMMMITGAKSIGILLSNNQTLRMLNMGWNDIGDMGISEIAQGLWSNKSLTNLNISMCQLSGKGNKIVCASHTAH